ncbi:DUF1284 domain-containing protein [Cohnella nanjingensis]|uniref:DUF1284 domain-containing protein n=1 Tax=Cohnella nanjingensis TaxID=1387779 RepID=A0A7X0VIH8_9BACL|nr:DUF1284 domain-containing protein [Cohnella nanjingensis]MBB6675202.1 DUF1284 domain-containing protein [Cohnella nanjingensis]
MTIRLRGHHLLCLLGYRGKGYSPDFCVNMTGIYETLRTSPGTIIELIDGPDDICRAYPADQVPHCENASVYRKDQEIAAQVGMALGERLAWSDICARVAANVQPDDIKHLCSDCIWEPYGVCKEGVAHIRSGGPLQELP